jgi:hypothetical protein
VFCRRLFVRLLFFWPLYCLFFDIQLFVGQKDKRRTNNLLQNTPQKTKSCISKTRQYNGQKNKRRTNNLLQNQSVRPVPRGTWIPGVNDEEIIKLTHYMPSETPPCK